MPSYLYSPALCAMLMVIVVLIGKGAYDWAQRRYGRFYRLVGFWVFILGVCLADYVGGTKSDPTNPPPCLSAPMGLGAAGICAAPPALLTDGEGAQTNSFRFNSIDRSDDSVVLDLSWNGADFSTSPFIELFSRTNLIIGGWRYVGWLQANPGETNVSVVVDANMLDDDALSPSLFFSARADEGPTYDGTDDDGDGVPNATERARGTNPRRTDSDGDGVPDSEELDFASTGEVIPDFNLSSLADVFADTTTFATYPPATSVNLPFAVEIAGGCSTQAIVHTCGMVTFLDVDSTGNPRTYTYNDTPASLYAGQNAIVSAYGFQFTMLGYFGAELRAGTVYASNGRWFVAEWRNLMDVMEYASLSLGRATFQLAVSEADPTTVHVRYLSLSGSYDGTDAIIGAHGLNGRQGLLVSNGDAGSVSTGMVLTYHWGTGTDPLNPDSDGDGLPDGWEIAYGMNPLVPNGTATDPRFAPDADPDLDQLTNRQESELGTNPFQPDSDGDGMDDGWEVAQGFDPAVHNSQTERTDDDPDADPDGDGLTNRQECEWRTNPNETDSDGDGVPDGTEIAQNSDPADGGDGGHPNSRVLATLVFGDHSSSRSEKYLVTLTPVPGSGTGAAPTAISRVSARYDGCTPQTFPLKHGWRYEVRLDHSGTDPAYTGSPSPDYDYTLQFSPQPECVLLEDPQGLFGVHSWSSGPFTAPQKVAYLSVLSLPQLTAPEVVGVNGDDDNNNGRADWSDTEADSSEDDLVEVKVKVAEPAGVQGTVTVTPYLSLLSGTLWKDREKVDSVGASDVIAIPNSGIVERTYYLEGSAHSSGYRGEHLEVKVECGSVTLATNHAFTVVGRIAEPITTELSGGLFANPCCAVAGAAVPLKVDVLPRDFPDSKIKWRVVSGGGSFTGGDTGRTVQFTPTGGEDALSVVQADVDDCPGSAPQLSVRTTTAHEVLIFPCVIETTDDASPITASTVAAMLNEINTIYRQVGLHFSLGAPLTNIVNDTWTRDGLVDTAVGAQIRNVLSNTGGIEVYFIQGSGANTEPIGSHTGHGIIIRNSANARSLAHEIGHACGWADIYIRKDSNTPIPTELYNRVNRDWAPDDWSGGGDVGGFYDTDLRQYDLIPRLLMYGVKNENQGDIPAGAVYGLPKTGDLGYVNVGRYGFFTPSPRSL